VINNPKELGIRYATLKNRVLRTFEALSLLDIFLTIYEGANTQNLIAHIGIAKHYIVLEVQYHI
jgi:hypothetical protein